MLWYSSPLLERLPSGSGKGGFKREGGQYNAKLVYLDVVLNMMVSQ